MGEKDIYQIVQSPENVTFTKQTGESGSVKEMR